MTDFATALYGTPEPAPVQAEPIVETEAEQPAIEELPEQDADSLPDDADNLDDEAAPALTAEAIAQGIPPEIKAMRDADEARRIYTAQSTFAKAIPDTAFDSLDAPPEVRAALVGEMREMALDLGLQAEDIPVFAQAISAPPMTPEQVADARDRCVEALNREFGMNAAQALRDARAFVAADPRRAAMLEKAGDHPSVVLRVAQLAQAAKRRR